MNDRQDDFVGQDDGWSDETAEASLPELVVYPGDLPRTARDLRDVLAASGLYFDRNGPVKIIRSADGVAPVARPLTVNNVVSEAHALCRPVKWTADGYSPITLPDRVARMYLDMEGDWHLPPLAGLCLTPLLSNNGQILVQQGYASETCLFCTGVPEIDIRERPTRDEASAALALIRHTFCTFPFADAPRVLGPRAGIHVVDLTQPPGQDESAFLTGLLTAVCRPSLHLAPGFIACAPMISGAGCGKGLLVRAISIIAFGLAPRAFTAGSERQELEKRLAAELIEATPTLFLDNLNGTLLRSDLLAAVLTERPCRVRILGQTRMAVLNSTAWVAITGNGSTLSEDLARRFTSCELDARCEDPESRPFAAGFLDEIVSQRGKLLGAALTIWRWGRQNAANLVCGRSLGSYEMWCRWVRDPLVSLGCVDPVARLSELKARDPHRCRIVEFFQVWWSCHRDEPKRAAELNDAVREIADPQKHGRQFLANYLARLAGTRTGGFLLTRQEPTGRWGAATYALKQTSGGNEGRKP